MTKKEKKRLEIIENLTRTIENGGNPTSIYKLKEILQSMKDGTFTIQKRRGRTPRKKSEKEELKPNPDETI